MLVYASNREGMTMGGFIRKSEVIWNAALIVHTWGLRVFLACLLAHRGETFLAILTRYGRV